MITLEHICAGYGGVEILHDVCLTLETNQSLSIVGPNGCGKTTLLRTIAGTLPFTGNIFIKGVDIRTIKRKSYAKKVAMLSQSTQMHFNYSALEIVLMGRYVHGKADLLGGITPHDKECALLALETVGMEIFCNRAVSTLSGGQLQRVLLAKILAQDPNIILLDEPTNHLDLRYQIELVSFLREWTKQPGKMVIGVLHDINLAMLLADLVLVLDHGTVKAYGKNHEVYATDIMTNVYQMDVGNYMLESFAKWNKIMQKELDAL